MAAQLGAAARAGIGEMIAELHRSPAAKVLKSIALRQQGSRLTIELKVPAEEVGPTLAAMMNPPSDIEPAAVFDLPDENNPQARFPVSMPSSSPPPARLPGPRRKGRSASGTSPRASSNSNRTSATTTRANPSARSPSASTPITNGSPSEPPLPITQLTASPFGTSNCTRRSRNSMAMPGCSAPTASFSPTSPPLE